MYSNERGSRFNILDLVVKIIFFILFVLVLLWLFPKVPNMTPFYSNVFRENISYMQEAGEAFFTNDKLPEKTGEEARIALAELFDKKLVLPFVDKDGNSCNQYDSYVSVTKNEDGSYSLKTNLVCNGESDYLVKVLGCHNYCKDSGCDTCYKEQVTQYQYKKAVSKGSTVYSCPSGYNRDGKYCYKNVLKNSKSAEITKVINKTLTMQPKTTTIEGTRQKLEVIKKTSPDTTKWVDCSYEKTEKQCKNVTEKQNYKCNCVTHRSSDGSSVTTCNTCTRTIQVEKCEYPTVIVPKTCPVTVPGETITSCPPEANEKTGDKETLQCFKVTEAKTITECTDKTYSLVNGVCIKVVSGSFTEYKCTDKGYVLENKVCKLYGTNKISANSSTTKKTTYKYTWSEKTSLSGWIKTGKTKTTEGKEICE